MIESEYVLVQNLTTYRICLNALRNLVGEDEDENYELNDICCTINKRIDKLSKQAIEVCRESQ